MIYQFTGQPGHGKTLHAIDMALDFKAKGRNVYVCNVRGFDYEKTGMLKMTPDDFKNWMEFLPDGAVALVDECYEHGMLPKRPASAKVPEHVEQLAKHRHRGIDFIFVCQSPDKQTDVFVHDLIEQHVHVRRLFGSKFCILRKFERFEANAEKATPISTNRVPLPKRPMGTYESTELDTTQRRVPWYWYAMIIGLPLGVGYILWTFSNMDERLLGDRTTQEAEQPGGNGGVAAGGAAAATSTPEQFIQQFIPRIPSQPWSAPAYDGQSVSSEPPRVFCMIGGHQETGTCTCLTEQGTRYMLDLTQCRFIARHGQYEPYREERQGQSQDTHSVQHSEAGQVFGGEGHSPSAMGPGGPAPVRAGSGQQLAAYGAFRAQANPAP